MKKIITFPHLGNLKISIKSFLQELGFEMVIPPDNTQKTLDLGVKYSPEHACLPLKITLGNFIEALEQGANVILMAGGIGPCRLGYYAEVQREILEDLGYDFKMCSLEPNLKETYHTLRYLGISIPKLIKGLVLTVKKIMAIDEVNKLAAKTRAREKKEGQVDRLFNKFLQELEETMSICRINKIKNNYYEQIKDCQGEFKRGLELKIGIVGEIYMVIDSFANLDLEKRLGQLGAVVEREIYISSWIAHFLNLANDRKMKKYAKPYLDNFVGGHGLHSVGDTVKYSREGFDGVIQVGPFTCMPEIVARTILNDVEENEDISLMTFFMDEQRGEAGFQTRLEAFVDLLIRNKIADAG